MVIPDGEGKQRTTTFSSGITKVIFWTLLMGTVGSAIALIYSIPRARDYQNLSERYEKILGEREAILTLAKDLDKIRQMENVVRQGLGLEVNSVLGDSVTMEDIVWIKMESPHMPKVLPIKGLVTQGLYIDSRKKEKNHYGIDIAVKKGEPILAVAAGRVVFSGWSDEFGNLIISYHGDGYLTFYGHNSANLVLASTRVKQGEIIAHSGNTGLSSGPHLHFEVWKDQEPVNPILFFPEYGEESLSGDKDG
jgi:hypothetical protein